MSDFFRDELQRAKDQRARQQQTRALAAQAAQQEEARRAREIEEMATMVDLIRPLVHGELRRRAVPTDIRLLEPELSGRWQELRTVSTGLPFWINYKRAQAQRLIDEKAVAAWYIFGNYYLSPLEPDSGTGTRYQLFMTEYGRILAARISTFHQDFKSTLERSHEIGSALGYEPLCDPGVLLKALAETIVERDLDVQL